MWRFFRNFSIGVVALFVFLTAHARDQLQMEVISASHLPIEAQETLNLIKAGGPFPFAKDGAVFGNYENSLPKQHRGYYHEYTVKTRGAHNRGARRIIVGSTKNAQGSSYYTDDHYATFKRINE